MQDIKNAVDQVQALVSAWRQRLGAHDEKGLLWTESLKHSLALTERLEAAVLHRDQWQAYRDALQAALDAVKARLQKECGSDEETLKKGPPPMPDPLAMQLRAQEAILGIALAHCDGQVRSLQSTVDSAKPAVEQAQRDAAAARAAAEQARSEAAAADAGVSTGIDALKAEVQRAIEALPPPAPAPAPAPPEPLPRDALSLPPRRTQLDRQVVRAILTYASKAQQAQPRATVIEKLRQQGHTVTVDRAIKALDRRRLPDARRALLDAALPHLLAPLLEHGSERTALLKDPVGLADEMLARLDDPDGPLTKVVDQLASFVIEERGLHAPPEGETLAGLKRFLRQGLAAAQT
jgi:hypothetical protein